MVSFAQSRGGHAGARRPGWEAGRGQTGQEVRAPGAGPASPTPHRRVAAEATAGDRLHLPLQAPDLTVPLSDPQNCRLNRYLLRESAFPPAPQGTGAAGLSLGAEQQWESSDHTQPWGPTSCLASPVAPVAALASF